MLMPVTVPALTRGTPNNSAIVGSVTSPASNAPLAASYAVPAFFEGRKALRQISNTVPVHDDNADERNLFHKFTGAGSKKPGASGKTEFFSFWLLASCFWLLWKELVPRSRAFIGISGAKNG